MLQREHGGCWVWENIVLKGGWGVCVRVCVCGKGERGRVNEGRRTNDHNLQNTILSNHPRPGHGYPRR
jgi:hypothetical protein